MTGGRIGAAFSAQETVTLSQLSDVTLTSPVDNNLLAYDLSSASWINQTPSQAGLNDIYLQIVNNLSDLNNAVTARTNLGLGSIATQAANNVTITGGSITGITDLVVADGGTGASNLTGILVGNGTSAFTAITTSAGLAGQISDETGTGALVFANSPVLVTPILGVAAATSLDVDSGGITLKSGGQEWFKGITGDKISLYEDRLGAITMYGFGVESGTLYYKTSGTHRWYSGVNADTGTSSIMELVNAGKLGIGVTGPTAILHLKAGTATANTAPLKFNSGTLLTAAEAGAIEFLTDAFYGTITTGAARKTFAFTDSAISSTTYVGTTAIALNRASAAQSLTGITSIDGQAATVVTNANLTGVITSIGNATSIASQTGTGTKFVVDTSPTIVTPTIAKLANLTSNGFIKTSGSDGTLGIDANTKSIWVNSFGGPNGPTLVVTYGTNGAYIGYKLQDANNNSGSVTFAVPTGFTTLTKAVVVFIPMNSLGTYVDGNNVRVSIYCNYGSSGASFQTGNTSIVNSLLVATHDQILEWDISSALTGIAAGDRVGIIVNRTGDNAGDTYTDHVLLLGVLLEYT